MAAKKLLSAKEFKALPEKDKVLYAIGIFIDVWGEVLPPKEVLMIGLSAKCPSCGKVGPILKDFGIKYMEGKPTPQSWCTECRGSKAARPGMTGATNLPKAVRDELSPAAQSALMEFLKSADGHAR